MLPLRLADMSWPQVDALDRDLAVPILPVGAIEAHGPHLPLGTDVIIAEAMAAAAAAQLQARGLSPVVLPTLAYTAAPFAASFAGTLSCTAATTTATLLSIAASLRQHGFRTLAIANAHFDPANVGALRDAVRACESNVAGLDIVFPDLTRRALAARLTEEFRSGACHAGQYEGSILLAVRPDLVQTDLAAGLPDNPASLPAAMRSGKSSFVDAGGPQAYFGFPARATADEGRRTIEVLGEILCEAVRAVRDTREAG